MFTILNGAWGECEREGEGERGRIIIIIHSFIRHNVKQVNN